MNHNNKRKLARRMLSKQEVKNNESIFQSKQWEQRKLDKQRRVDRLKRNK